MEACQRWIPLESNPKVLNKYVHNLGMDSSWNFVDVYGFDADLLAMVPKPVAAIILLFPDTKELIGEIQTDYPKDLYYTKQTIENACGTVAIVHALANNKNEINFDENKHFKTFLEMTNGLSPEERAKFLEQDNKMGAAHDDCAQEGDTQAPSVDERVKSHFVTFVQFNGTLYELDGRKDAPVVHGTTTPDTFLEDSAEVIKKFISRDPENVNFNVMALVKGGEEQD
ncbi:ubiquitin carboxyl-terminal hydrolase [Biomphalaria glabrata]|uniref:Ubiquitin carboxyl-terminal hydrolase n=1 Tax=Biomphalaria glabrata TaxID=6526 RepID=A0A2C9LNF9_BIOGL|nr:ubiquitin carboxyl-terminal hydrolase-like isoform X1 [Biomphalaria glabrata]KAI8734090.1 ubiquitin carboxyl-terminal hydrolase-like [Biomphalaria glabrata]KAI8761691.1 ubiquitin carboxyl-terminal hydrolase [Biomphalaria glabrata]